MLHQEERLVTQVCLLYSWHARWPYCRGRLSTVDILVLTSLDQLLFIVKILFTYVTKQASLVGRPSPLVSVPWLLVSLPGAQHLTGKNLKALWAEFSTLS